MRRGKWSIKYAELVRKRFQTMSTFLSGKVEKITLSNITAKIAFTKKQRYTEKLLNRENSMAIPKISLR